MKQTAFALLVLLSTTVASAETFRTGRVWTQGGELTVVPRAQFDWRYTWYGPEVFQYPNGDLGFYAHSGNPSVDRTGLSDLLGRAKDECGGYTPAGIDVIYGARRDAGGAWTTPAFGACPTIKGMHRSRSAACLNYDPQVNDATDIDPVGTPSIVRIANSSSATGWRYYMAFNGGNSDFITGKIYWAVSDDGVSWSTYSWNAPVGYERKWIVGPEYLDCDGGVSVTGKPQGVMEPFLAFDPNDTAGGRNLSGTFYLYFTYAHLKPGDSLPTYDVYAFRFGYNPGHPYGFGNNPEIYFNGSWRAHSGRLVWDYDNKPVIGSDPLLTIGQSMKSWRNASDTSNGKGDLKRNPDTGVWYHVSTWGSRTGVQTASRLDQDNWSVPTFIDMSSITNLYGQHCQTFSGSDQTITYDPGIWYGTLGGRRGWWIWQPVPVAKPDSASSPVCFAGLGIVVAKLCPSTEAGCDQ